MREKNLELFSKITKQTRQSVLTKTTRLFIVITIKSRFLMSVDF